MILPLVKLGERLESLAALFLLLWSGGLNCLTGCAMALAVTDAPSHCSMSGEGDCCQSRTGGEDMPSDTTAVVPGPTAIQSLPCCSLEAYSAEVNRNVRIPDGALMTPASSQRDFTLKGGPPAKPPDRWVRLPDRGGTHLRCCVFLI